MTSIVRLSTGAGDEAPGTCSAKRYLPFGGIFDLCRHKSWNACSPTQNSPGLLIGDTWSGGAIPRLAAVLP